MKHLFLQSIKLVLLLLPLGLTAQFSFVDRSNTLFFQNSFSGAPIAVADMNSDGLDDIVRLNGTFDLIIDYQTPPLDPNFNGVSFGTISNSQQWGMCIADYDKNGFNDIFSGGSYDGLKLQTANGTGMGYSSSVIGGAIFLQGSNFADINNDGWVDIYANHDDGLSEAYRNTGTGFAYDPDLIFPASTIPSDNSGNYASIWTDFDNDGDLDVYISKCRLGVDNPNDGRRRNLMFRNDGNNNYTDVAAEIGLLPFGQSWATDFGDIDNDGDLDAFIINHDIANQLLVNDGNGNYSDISLISGILGPTGDAGAGIQVRFADFDNDGFLDILYTSLGADEALLRNNGDNTFTDFADVLPVPKRIHTAATGDLNNDGFIDIIAGFGDNYNSTGDDPDRLLINSGNSNNYLKVHLEGVLSNINGIGSRIELFGPWGIQVREVRSGEGYGIMHSFTQHFGMAGITTADSLRVKWPSGTIDKIDLPTANQTLTIIEGSSCVGVIDFSANLNGTLTVDFANISSVGSDSVYWSFGDGNTSNELNPNHTYNGPNTYQVCLYVDGLCDQGQICKNIPVFCPPPEVIFSFESNALTVNFTDLSLNTPDNYLWSFGDGENSIEANPSHTYSAVGVYQVCLIAANECGTGQDCTMISLGCEGFNLGFGSSSNELAVNFTGTADGALVFDWDWDFGDGNTGTGINPSHTYQAPGTYTVCVNTNGSCGMVEICNDVEVVCSPPGISFNAGSVELDWNFIPNSTFPLDSVYWDFGDGNSSSDSLSNHTYAGPGTYEVCLQGFSACGNNEVCSNITVSCSAPAAGFSIISNQLDITISNTANVPNGVWSYTFGDGNDSDELNPSHSYMLPGSYEVCQTISSICGTTTLCESITVSCPPPVVLFNAVVSGLTANFNDQSDDTAQAWLWDFGDNTVSNQQNPQKIYNTPGTYEVCLTVSSLCGSSFFCQSVTVTCNQPQANILSEVEGLTISLNNSGTGDELAYSWTFGDGNSSDGVTPNHTYDAPGTYEVCLTVSNICGTDSQCTQVTVSCSSPSPSFTSDIDGLFVQFMETITVDYDSIRWTFGNGLGTSNDPNPSFDFPATGNYQVCLELFDLCGSNVVCQTISINCNPSTAAFATVSNELDLLFNYTGSGNPTSWLWTFGDGAESSIENPNHSYLAPGEYEVCLTVMDDCGSDQFCQVITVNCLAPQAEFSFSADNFDYSFSEEVTGENLAFLWTFGDGNQSSQANPSHSYAMEGTFEVCLNVSNICGFTERCEMVFVTCPTPNAGFTVSINELTVSLASLDETDASLSWTLGDGSMETASSFNYSYAAPGNYTICVTALNDCGEDQSCQTVNLSCAAPEAAFSSTTDGITQFTDLSTNNPDTWLWTFGDGASSSEQNPQHQYSGSGTYTVCLTTSSACGENTLCQAVEVFINSDYEVSAMPDLSLFPNPAQGQLNIDWPSAPSYWQVQIWSLRGRLVRDYGQQSANLVQIDLSNIPSGYYLIRGQSELGPWTRSLVID